MNLKQMECFLEAAKCLNFSEASEKLFMSQPTFSRTISSLEKEIGITLFIRDYKNTRLTPGGAILMKGFSKLLSDYENYLRKAIDAERGHKGYLSIGFLEGPTIEDPLQKALQYFNINYPDIKIDLARYTSRALQVAMDDGSIDIAISLSFDVIGKFGFHYEIIRTMPNLLLVPKTHPILNKENLTLIDFKNIPFITVSEKESVTIHQLLINMCREAGFEPKLITADDFGKQILLLEAGYGIAVLSENHIAHCNPALKAISIPELHEVSSVVVWKENNYNPIITIFVDSVLKMK